MVDRQKIIRYKTLDIVFLQVNECPTKKNIVLRKKFNEHSAQFFQKNISAQQKNNLYISGKQFYLSFCFD